MAYEFQVLGWEDWYGERHDEPPTYVPDVQGMFYFLYDDDTGDQQWKWIYIDPPFFDDFQDWYDLIELAIEDYGLQVA